MPSNGPTTVQDLIDKVSSRKSKPATTLDFAQASFSKGSLKALEKTAGTIRSANKMINDILLKRAALQERFELARSRGNTMEALSAKKQLDLLAEQKTQVEGILKLESEQRALHMKRNILQTQLMDSKIAETKQGQILSKQMVELNDQLIQVTSKYEEQLRVTGKVLDGVMDVKKAHELVNAEIEQEQKKLDYMSKNMMQKLGAVMADQFGEGFDRIKSDVKDKLIMFTKLGAGIGFGVAAVKDLSKDSDEVVNTLYRMGGSLDRVNNKMDYYTSSVLELNKVQTSLRMTAAAMNMPVEAVEGMTEQIMTSIRVLDKSGKISFNTVKQIGADALNFARRTGIDAKDAVNLISVMVNKYGQTSETSGKVLDGVAASVIAANDSLEDLGQGKAGIFIEDIANMIKDAADNTDGFSLSLGKLGNIASNQMMIARKFGATYNEALNQAKTLTEFMTKRNPYANYRLGVGIAKDFMADKDIQGYVAAKDVDGLTKFIGTKYGVSGNEANIVAKAVINKQGNWMETVGKFMGGTKFGQEKTAEMLEGFASSAISNPQSEFTQRQLAAGLMGQDANSEAFQSMFNTWVEEAKNRQKSGQPVSGFISAKNLESMSQYKKAQAQAGYENTEKQSPITPTSLRETLDAVFQSPFNRLVIAGAAILSATVWNGKQLMTIAGLLGGRFGGGVPGGMPGGVPAGGAPGAPTSGSWKDAAKSAKDRIANAKAAGGYGGAARAAGSTLLGGAKGLIRNPLVGSLLAGVGTSLAFSYAEKKLTEMDSDRYDVTGAEKNYYQKNMESLGKQLADYTQRAEDAKLAGDEEKFTYYSKKLVEAKADLDWFKQQGSVYMEKMSKLTENRAEITRLREEIKGKTGIERNDRLAELQKLESENEALEVFEAAGKQVQSSVSRSKDILGQGMAKTMGLYGLKLAGEKFGAQAGKGALSAGIKVASRTAGTRGVKTAATLGAKMMAKQGAKTGLRAIPILGSLLSAGTTAYMTEGSVGRKLFAAGGDLVGTLAGQAATGGIGGGIVGGLAGEYGGLSAYDSLFGNNDSARSLVASQVVPQQPTMPSSSATSGSNGGSNGSGGKSVLDGVTKVVGNKLHMVFDMFNFGSSMDKVDSKMLQRQTGKSVSV